MDPLSIIASIAGVAQAGVSLSKAIYNLISTTQGAPKEIADIARGISELSVFLREVRRILKDGIKLFRRTLLRNLASAMKRIGAIHREIDQTGIARLTVASRPRKTPNDDSDDENDRALRRQQAENVVEASYQSMRELAETGATDSPPDQIPSDAIVLQGSGDLSATQLSLWKENSRSDTANWLYETVFRAYMESQTQEPGHPDSEVEDDTGLFSVEGRRTANYLSLTVTKKPINPTRVVDELLAEWTDLSDDEISGLITKTSKSKGPRDQEPPEDEDEWIRFKDAVGRKFSFPYSVVRTWLGMEELIKQAFLHVDVIGPHVQEGHYDLIGPSGEIFLPQIWEKLIRPGYTIEMRMWPIDKPPMPPAGMRPAGPPRVPQAPDVNQERPQSTPHVPSQTLPEMHARVPARGSAPSPPARDPAPPDLMSPPKKDRRARVSPKHIATAEH
ncbi:hypothetical protein CSOJ01_15882 [Colletotrichum sojae]|uniref:Ubiquitin-like domain-containing protein n=1 Tax=Colletotrichum sojae TaxID=2175907 RepID=A0A8H6IM23_9PEZI|nr:hypothetical protein CSOJ01_15882 [Colletotrichum sojae]